MKKIRKPKEFKELTTEEKVSRCQAKITAFIEESIDQWFVLAPGDTESCHGCAFEDDCRGVASLLCDTDHIFVDRK